MSLAGVYGPAGDDEERFKVLDAAYELGARHWDDADVYGDTEELVGKWFERNPEKRKDIFLTTKFGIAAFDVNSMTIRSDPEYVRSAVESSLKKLKTDYIDLYYCHRVDGKSPIEQTLKAMVELKNEGKIKYIGLSEVTVTTLKRAAKVHHIAALQIEYSPWVLDIERSVNGNPPIFNTCKELGTAIVAYSPLGRGFLTGTIKSPEDVQNDWRASVPRFQKEFFDKNMELTNKFKALAEKKGLTASQLVLAWLMRQGELVHVLFGTRSAARLRENLFAVTVELSDEEDKTLRALSEQAQNIGERFPDVFADMMKGETPELK
ncbi:alcohol dehydrogenase [Exophiala aquamarina CBS 119918]|uniref:Alcohol dehydrogenase n=1 Tax=Exophiala aquamarina CBS 119918 TaxID=1182545 RepID=A0A072PUH2_9EURO|nr:alcohol dehydrogenase [Exophiala aquamarina CBS 119918]KEF63382.1 alcohol dehydrogenase [Exophiala aquamarina CBS 119918]